MISISSLFFNPVLHHYAHDQKAEKASFYLDRQADDLLENSFYWLGIKNIEISIRELKSFQIKLTAPRKIKTFNLLDKINRVVKAIALLIPGLLLKIFVFIFFKEIRKRNQNIIDLLNDLKNRNYHYSLPRPQVFNSPSISNNNSFILSLDIQLIILSYLNLEERTRLALTCKKYHDLIVKEFTSSLPQAIEKVLSEKKLTDLPHAILPFNSYLLFEGSQFQFLSSRFDKKMGSDSPLPIEGNFYQSINLGIAKEILNKIGDQSLQTIQTSQGKGLIVIIKNNDSSNICYASKQAFIIIKRNKKWMVFGLCLYQNLLLFLNNLRFHENSLLVEDYLLRLFKGEPCGCFPFSLNKEVSDKINYQDVPGTLLQEGPRLCRDGKTPLIQLW